MIEQSEKFMSKDEHPCQHYDIHYLKTLENSRLLSWIDYIFPTLSYHQHYHQAVIQLISIETQETYDSIQFNPIQSYQLIKCLKIMFNLYPEFLRYLTPLEMSILSKQSIFYIVTSMYLLVRTKTILNDSLIHLLLILTLTYPRIFTFFIPSLSILLYQSSI